jgi:hypothetical protein
MITKTFSSEDVRHTDFTHRFIIQPKDLAASTTVDANLVINLGPVTPGRWITRAFAMYCDPGFSNTADVNNDYTGCQVVVGGFMVQNVRDINANSGDEDPTDITLGVVGIVEGEGPAVNGQARTGQIVVTLIPHSGTALSALNSGELHILVGLYDLNRL